MADKPEGTQDQEVDLHDALQPWETHLRGPGDLRDTLFKGWESAKEEPDADGDDAEVEDEEVQDIGDDVDEDEEDEESEDQSDEDDGAEDDEASEDEATDEDAEEDEKPKKSDKTPRLALPDGEEVTAEDVLELKRGNLRQADYTRKTQEAAAIRKEATERRDQLDRQLTEVKAVLEMLAPEEPDWAKLRAENPAEYAAQAADWDRFQKRLGAVNTEIEANRQAARAEFEKEMQEVARVEHEKLLQAFPEWLDDKVRESQRAALWDFATKTYGFSEEELNGAIDSRLIRLLVDAKKQSDVEAKAEELRKKGGKKGKKQGSKTLKPGSSRSRTEPTSDKKLGKQRNEALSRWQQTGRNEDALGFFEAFAD